MVAVKGDGQMCLRVEGWVSAAGFLCLYVELVEDLRQGLPVMQAGLDPPASA